MIYSLGIDLASSADNWGVVRVDWSSGRRPVASPWVVNGSRVDTWDRLLDAVETACDEDAPVGIDAPLGWPKGAKRWLAGKVPPEMGGVPWHARFRVTEMAISAMKKQAHRGSRTDAAQRDLEVLQRENLFTDPPPDPWIDRYVTPISAVTDRLTASAVWAQNLLRHFNGDTDPQVSGPGWGVEQRGECRFYETYPSAVHGCFESPSGREDKRLRWFQGGVDLDSQADDAARSTLTDHEIDAGICAVIAMAAARGLTRTPDELLGDIAANEDRVKAEGWIHIPKHTGTWMEFVEQVQGAIDTV